MLLRYWQIFVVISKETGYLVSGMLGTFTLAPLVAPLVSGYSFSLTEPVATIIAACISGAFVYAARRAQHRYESKWRQAALSYKLELTALKRERESENPYTPNPFDQEHDLIS